MRVKLFILLILSTALIAGAAPKEFLKLIPAVDNRQYNKWTDSKLFRQGYEALSYESLSAKMAREIDVDITVALDSTINILEQELKQHPRNGYAACNLAIAKLLIRGSMSPEGEWPDYYHDDDELEPEELAQIEQQRAANKALCEEIVTLFNRSLKLIPSADTQSHCVAYRGIAFAQLIQQADNSLIENAIEKAIFEANLGVTPSIDACSICGSDKAIVTLSSDDGGYVCKNCYSNQVMVSDKTIKMIRLYYYVDLSKITKLEVSNEVTKEINDFLDRYYERYTGLYLKSKDFMKQIEKLSSIKEG